MDANKIEQSWAEGFVKQCEVRGVDPQCLLKLAYETGDAYTVNKPIPELSPWAYKPPKQPKAPKAPVKTTNTISTITAPEKK